MGTDPPRVGAQDPVEARARISEMCWKLENIFRILVFPPLVPVGSSTLARMPYKITGK